MVYRDWLCSLSPVVMSYVSTLSHKRRSELGPQVVALYDLAQQMGKADFVAALELLAEQQMYGAEYIQALLSQPSSPAPHRAAQAEELLCAVSAPAQWEVERDLEQYEQYVANRESLAVPSAASRTGGQA